MTSSLRRIRAESGFISVDFLFGFILVMGISVVLLAFSFTLSVIEGMQYVAFASARSAFASHKTLADQVKLGEAKYVQLLKTKGLSNLMKKEWFKLDHKLGDNSADYSPDQNYKNKFFGMIINIQVSYLDFVIPLYGSTTGDGGGGFPARVTGFLGRESSAEECGNFMSQRVNWIQSQHSGPSYSGTVVMGDDNGC